MQRLVTAAAPSSTNNSSALLRVALLAHHLNHNLHLRAPAAVASAAAMKFRPCIDLHDGVVKQIVGSTLRDEAGGAAPNTAPVTNFVATKSAAEFARCGDRGGHGADESCAGTDPARGMGARGVRRWRRNNSSPF
jgi:hypothetical protein